MRLLNDAAGYEHALCCTYLFAALSLKADVSEGLSDDEMNRVTQWERLILMVARQEMEHLGLVCNLLTSIGGAPTFAHPAFPAPTSLFGDVLGCTRLDRATLQRFVCYERPQQITPADSFCAPGKPAAHATHTPPGPYRYQTVGELYALIRSTLIELCAQGVDLFIGQARNEITGQELGLDFPRYRAKGGVYDVFLFAIADRASALRAIDVIIEQGEGNARDEPVPRAFVHAALSGQAALEDPPPNPSHYRVFLQILAELEVLSQRNPAVDPARAVVPNPSLQPRAGTTLIEHPLARAVLGLFCDAYATMLLMLTRLFVHTDETVAEINELKSAAFFPFMTMLIRPLAEVLTTLPAGDPDRPERAGPCYDVPADLAFLPHRRSAFLVIGEQLHQLVEQSAAVARMAGAPPRLGYIAETVRLITQRWDKAMGAKR